MAELDINMVVLGKRCKYEPQPDITAYEAALLHKLLAVCISAITKTELRDNYIIAHGLERHWVPISQDNVP